MPQYLVEVAYKPEGWAALVRNPQNRIEAVRPAVEKLGGRIVQGWFSFGDYDIVLITDMPDNVTAAALSIAFSAGGAIKSSKTTALLTAEEAVDALKKASQSGYRAIAA